MFRKYSWKRFSKNYDCITSNGLCYKQIFVANVPFYIDIRNKKNDK